MAAIAAADLHVGPDLARSISPRPRHPRRRHLRRVHEHPVCSAYPGNIDLYSPVPCAPCWLTELCPFGHPCLHQITPQQVEEALKQLWEHKNQAGRRGPLVPTDDHDTAFSMSHGLSET